MSAKGFWLSDTPWTAIEPLLPKNRPGARRVDDRRVISGIVHVLKVGCRWQDCPAHYGPPTTIYNRFHRWSARGLWQKLFRTLVTARAYFGLDESGDFQGNLDGRVFGDRFGILETIDVEALFFGPARAGGRIC